MSASWLRSLTRIAAVRIARVVVTCLSVAGIFEASFYTVAEAQYLSPAGVTFSATVGAGAPPSQTITLNPVPTTRLRTWTVSKSANWLQVTPMTGDILNDTDLLTVSINTNGVSQGIYTDTILITLVDPGGIIRTTSTTVTLNMTGGSANPRIALSGSSVSFSGSAGGSAPPPQYINLTNPGGGTLSWNISSSAPWLIVTPTTGTTQSETDVITVTANTAGMSAGSYAGLLTVGGNGSNAPQQIPVNLTVSGQAAASAVLSVSPISLTANVALGSITTYNFSVSNSGGGGALTWTATDPVNWLLKNVDGGTTPGNLQVTLDTYLLPQGTYTTGITITAPGAASSPIVIPVTMNVGQSGSAPSGPQPPTLSVSPTSLSFSSPVGGSPLTTRLNVGNSGGGGSVQWSVTDPVDWLIKSVDYGVTPGALDVTVYPSVLPAGTHTTSITVTVPGATNSPMTIPVTLTVGSTSTASAVLSWNANSDSDLAGYKVYFGTSSGNYSTSMNVGNVTSYTVNGLSTGRTYYFTVSALDQAGNESGKSAERSVAR